MQNQTVASCDAEVAFNSTQAPMTQPIRNRAAVSDSDSEDSIMTVMHYLMIMASAVSSIASIASMAWFSDEEEDEEDLDFTSNRKREVATVAALSLPSPNPLLKTGLSGDEWQALCDIMVPVIDGTSKSTGAQKRKRGRPPKLSAATRLLNCILFLKKDESMSKASAAEDCIYICDLICQRLDDELSWPDSNRRSSLSQRSTLPGCIGFADDVIVHIPRPLIGPEEFHSTLYNGYVMLSAIAVDNEGFIIFADAARPGSMERLAPTFLVSDLSDKFAFTEDKPVEYLVGDYKGFGESSIMRSLGSDVDKPGAVLDAVKAKQFGHRVVADWGISGLHSQWGILSKPFTARRDKFNTILKSCCILTNFLHRRRRNLKFQDHRSDDIGAWSSNIVSVDSC